MEPVQDSRIVFDDVYCVGVLSVPEHALRFNLALTEQY